MSKAKAKITRASIVLTTKVKVPGAGKIVHGVVMRKGSKITLLCTAAKSVSRAATYTLTCKVGKAGRDALRKAKMTLTMTTTFTPTGGELAAKKQTVQLARRR
jgi:hypothetical protein